MRKALSAAGPRIYGVIFLVMVIVFVWLTYAVFTKKFSDYDKVTLETSSTGLQLPNRADVKIRGVIVGEVTEVNTNLAQDSESFDPEAVNREPYGGGWMVKAKVTNPGSLSKLLDHQAYAKHTEG